SLPAPQEVGCRPNQETVLEELLSFGIHPAQDSVRKAVEPVLDWWRENPRSTTWCLSQLAKARRPHTAVAMLRELVLGRLS
ncbi:unnamed protein product, partial [Polarella glacialis]